MTVTVDPGPWGHLDAFEQWGATLPGLSVVALVAAVVVFVGCFLVGVRTDLDGEA